MPKSKRRKKNGKPVRHDQNKLYRSSSSNQLAQEGRGLALEELMHIGAFLENAEANLIVQMADEMDEPPKGVEDKSNEENS